VKTTKKKILVKIVLALLTMGVSVLLVLYLVPGERSDDRMNLIAGIASAVVIFTVFSIFATIQEGKQSK